MLAGMRLLRKTVAVALVLLPGLALGQLQISLSFPEPPQLVVVSPGVQVVPNLDEEVFFNGGFYWHRRAGHWYRARDHRGSWALVEPRLVPGELVRVPPGQYRRFKVEEHPARAVKHVLKAEEKAEHGKHGKHGHGD